MKSMPRPFDPNHDDPTTADLAEDYPGQHISAPGDSPVPPGRRQRADGTWTYTTHEWDAVWYWPVGTHVRATVRGGARATGTIIKANATTAWIVLDGVEAGRRIKVSVLKLTRVEVAS